MISQFESSNELFSFLITLFCGGVSYQLVCRTSYPIYLRSQESANIDMFAVILIGKLYVVLISKSFFLDFHGKKF
jgi:hypothetical protein